jgi:hypothetical protein
LWFRSIARLATEELCAEYRPIPGEELLANARLIAAAPEMLEALNEILANLPGNTPGAVREIVESWAKPAIAKAEGLDHD